MKKALIRVFAVLLIVVLSLGVVGCHKPGEIAVTIEDEKFTSGFYACVFLAADNEARELISKQATEQNITITEKNLYEQKIDGVLYADWVKAKVTENFKMLIAAKNLCEKNSVDTASALETAKATAKTEWQNNREYFEKNGIGLESYQKFCAYQQYSTSYFDYLYRKGGVEEVTEDTINKFVQENYVYVDIISKNITDMTDAQKQDEEKKFKEYVDRIKKGESFGKIVAEINTTTYTEDKTDEGTFSHSQAMILGSENAGEYFVSPLFDTVKGYKKGDIKVLVTEKAIDGYTYMLLGYFGDILSEKNTSLTDIKEDALYAMKNDEFVKKIEDAAKDIVVKENKKSTKQFKVQKVYYPATVNY